MKRPAIFLLFSILISACAFTEVTPSNSWPSNERLSVPLEVININGIEGVILPASHAPAALAQCSRETLGPGDRYWVPSTEQIEVLEGKLSKYIQDINPEFLSTWNIKEFKRQYAGVIRNNKKTIYANLFYVKQDYDEWRNSVIVLCDGGPSFFGVEYDVTSGKFIHIAFNGVA